MFSKLGGGDTGAVLEALNKSQAVIEFKLDGTILTANQNFLGALGYSLDEIQDLVDYVWFHSHALKHLSQAERVNLIRRSVRASVHNPIAVAQVALEGA